MARRVISCYGLCPMMSLGPSAPDRSPTKIARGSTWASVGIAAQDLRLECHSHRPIRLRKGLARESISAKLIYLQHRGSLQPAPPRHLWSLVGTRALRGPSACEASNLHPQ
jgi:hypothetical protein